MEWQWRGCLVMEEGKGGGKDGVVVEGQRWQLVDRPPPEVGGIVAGKGMGVLGHADSIGGGDGAPAWVASQGAVDADKGQLLLSHDDAGLFLQLAHGAVFDGLVHLHESAGQGPAAAERLVAATDEERIAREAGEKCKAYLNLQ